MQTLAAHIEFELETSEWSRCAVYDEELQRLWPLNLEDRQKKIEEFAKEYGFSLQFYRKGICAIFGNQLPPCS